MVCLVSDHFQSVLPQSYMALVSLLPSAPPDAAIHLIDLLEPVTSEFLEKSPHSNVVMAIGKLLSQFYQLLFSAAQDIMKGACNPIYYLVITRYRVIQQMVRVR